MVRDTGGRVDYAWDMRGPQEPANWRSPCDHAYECAYARALAEREPEVLRAGTAECKPGLDRHTPGKLRGWIAGEHGLSAPYVYVYEPGGWSRDRLRESGVNLALALHDVLCSAGAAR